MNHTKFQLIKKKIKKGNKSERKKEAKKLQPTTILFL